MSRISKKILFNKSSSPGDFKGMGRRPIIITHSNREALTKYKAS